MIPPQLRSTLERHLGTDAAPARILDTDRVGGGCISPAARLQTTAGRFFLKWREPGDPIGLFPAESRSLIALEDAGVVRVPRVIGVDQDWLLLEWLEPGAPDKSTWAGLGTRLAALHRARRDAPGWDEDNFIGPLPQSNARGSGWPMFWLERRLQPQFEAAVHANGLERADLRNFDRLAVRLESLLAAGTEEGASLLHGDLWSGNVHVMRDGEAALIDPSSYYGHREVDLAMAELFGGFGNGFHQAYRNAFALLPGYPERRDIYQLYYLLVHVNLFGSSYVAAARAIIRRYGG